MEQTIIEQCTGLIPVPEHHHREAAGFRSWCCELHGLRHGLREVILEKPIARLAQATLAAHFVDLQVELRLFMRGFCCHNSLSPLLLFSVHSLLEGDLSKRSRQADLHKYVEREAAESTGRENLFPDTRAVTLPPVQICPRVRMAPPRSETRRTACYSDCLHIV